MFLTTARALYLRFFYVPVGRAVQEDGVQRSAQEEEPGLQVHIHAGRAQGGESPALDVIPTRSR